MIEQSANAREADLLGERGALLPRQGLDGRPDGRFQPQHLGPNQMPVTWLYLRQVSLHGKFPQLAFATHYSIIGHPVKEVYLSLLTLGIQAGYTFLEQRVDGQRNSHMNPQFVQFFGWIYLRVDDIDRFYQQGDELIVGLKYQPNGFRFDCRSVEQPTTESTLFGHFLEVLEAVEGIRMSTHAGDVPLCMTDTAVLDWKQGIPDEQPFEGF